MNCDCLCCWNSKNHRQYGKNHSKRYGSYDYIGLWEDYISLTDPDLAEPHAEGCGFGRERVEVRRLSACSMKMDICVRFKISRDTFSRFRNMYPSVCRAHREKGIVVFQDSVKKGYIYPMGNLVTGMVEALSPRMPWLIIFWDRQPTRRGDYLVWGHFVRTQKPWPDIMAFSVG